MIPNDGFASLLKLGPEEIVQADVVDIQVPGYSVPSYVDWDNDGKKDLIVGVGGNWQSTRIRVYLNQGTPSEPYFSDYLFIEKSNGKNITYLGVECLCRAMGLFPRLVDWDSDERKDLLVGQFDGTAMIYLNVGTDGNPVFNDGTFLQVGEAGSKVNIDVGDLTAPTVVDWNNDNLKDLVIGGIDGKLHLFINQGTNAAPDFLVETFVQENGSDLVAPAWDQGVYPQGESPLVLDLDADGRKDLLIGNSEGRLLFYSNVGTDEEPSFSGYSLIESDGVPIRVAPQIATHVDAMTGASPRARPFVTDWTGDGYLDVLIGAGDGKVYLYQSIPQPGDIDNDYDVDLVDFALFAAYWQRENCDGCGGADFNGDGKVDIDDLVELLTYWLEAANL